MLEGNRDDGLCHAAERWLDDEEYWRWFTYEEGDIDDSMPSNCPLIELPNHGDLVDVDMLKAECKEPYVWWETETQMAVILNDAPVVIPAERSRDGEA